MLRKLSCSMAILSLLLIAGCGGGGSGGDDSSNSSPSAVAGDDQRVLTGATVVLEGSASWDFDGDPLNYSWSFIDMPEGSTAVLSDPAAVAPSFVPDLGGRYKLGLIVNDGTADSFQNTVTVFASSAPPVADAGPDQGVAPGARVQLNGGGTGDVDGNPLSYSWTFTSVPAGSAAVLDNASSPYPSFTADLVGDYGIELVADDGISGSSADTVTVRASHPPTADAGADQGVATNSPVTLDGSASSDPDGDALTYEWTFISTPGGALLTPFDPAAAQPTFTPTSNGNYVLALTVSDGTLESTADTVTISASSSPVANAGADKNYTSGSLVTLDSSKSYDPDDPSVPDDGSIASYLWSFVADPSGSATLSDPATPSPTFTPAVNGDYVLRLVVSDGVSDSAPDEVTITVLTAPGAPLVPIADTGQNLCYDEAGNEIDCVGTGQDGDYVINPMDFALNLDGTITDNVTGLMWQKCSSGQSGPLCGDTAVTLHNGYQALGIYDATFNPVSTDVCGDLELAGYSDWRLPSSLELMQILDYGREFPAIDPLYFPSTVPYFYWTSTCLNAPDCTTAYWVDFGYGQQVHYGWGRNMEEDLPVRCVRGETVEPYFADNGDGTVTDLNAGLDWQRDDGGIMTWQQALDYCGDLGPGWRLPDIKELASVISAEEYLPFSGPYYSGFYWSSTNVGSNASVAGLDFAGFPMVYTTEKTNDTFDIYARCVR